MEFMRGSPFQDEVPVADCWERTCKAPITTELVDINRGTEEEPHVRCRLVARHFKPKGEKDRDDLFAALPPLEAKKLLFRMAAIARMKWKSGKDFDEKVDAYRRQEGASERGSWRR